MEIKNISVIKKIFPYSFEVFHTLFELQFGIRKGILTIVPYMLEKRDTLMVVFITVKSIIKIFTNSAENSMKMFTFVIIYRRSGISIRKAGDNKLLIYCTVPQLMIGQSSCSETSS